MLVVKAGRVSAGRGGELGMLAVEATEGRELSRQGRGVSGGGVDCMLVAEASVDDSQGGFVIMLVEEQRVERCSGANEGGNGEMLGKGVEPGY